MRKTIMNNNINETINKIGASYLISYLYGQYIDKNHDNYKRRETDKTALIERYKDNYHKMVEAVLEMDENKLESNEIGLSGVEVKKMAKKLLPIL